MVSSYYPVGSTRFRDVDYKCVYVTYLNDDYVSLPYNLETGKIDLSCISPIYIADSWHESTAFYLDNQCNGTTYGASVGAYSAIIQVNNAFFYVDGEPDIENPDVYYAWDKTDDECEERNNSSEMNFWTYKPVPDWVLNALPDAPYTLTLEY
ncbi:MAG: hypothetical protein JXA30_17620 [Deltaproteobacteria bacterium]|nr:hypothetical protein [Deltaproteobacteria bacterium]